MDKTKAFLAGLLRCFVVAVILWGMGAIGQVIALYAWPKAHELAMVAVIAAIGAVAVEHWLLNRSYDRQSVDATYQDLDDLDQPPLLAKLLRIHVSFLSRWCQQSERWTSWLAVAAMISFVVGIAFTYRSIVWMAGGHEGLAWMAAALTVSCFLLAGLMILIGDRGLRRAGQAVRQLDVTRNLELIKLLNASHEQRTRTIRINAGGPAFQDSIGRSWLADCGFTDGQTFDRGEIPIRSPNLAKLYRSERWGMTTFNYELANGTYIVNLHFAETDAGVAAAAQRLFTYTVQGTAVANFDVFAEAQNARATPVVKTHRVVVANQQLQIAFTRTNMDPVINGVEIIPST